MPKPPRDPERIARMLVKLDTYWRTNTDLRLTQIVWMLAGAGKDGDPFYVEDGPVEEKLDKLIAKSR